MSKKVEHYVYGKLISRMWMLIVNLCLILEYKVVSILKEMDFSHSFVVRIHAYSVSKLYTVRAPL